jgi:hypothetical protein
VVDENLRTIRAAIRALLDQISGVIQMAVTALKRVIERLEQLVFVDILERLQRVVDNLGDSFEVELDRVRGAFDEMLNAIPLEGGSVTVEVSL